MYSIKQFLLRLLFDAIITIVIVIITGTLRHTLEEEDYQKTV